MATTVQQILDTTLDELRHKQWVHREPKSNTDETCLIVAFGAGVRAAYARDIYAGSAGLVDDARRIIVETIREKYPDRRDDRWGEPMIAFNDHPATHFEDVVDVALTARRKVEPDAEQQQS